MTLLLNLLVSGAVDSRALFCDMCSIWNGFMEIFAGLAIAWNYGRGFLPPHESIPFKESAWFLGCGLWGERVSGLGGESRRVVGREWVGWRGGEWAGGSKELTPLRALHDLLL